MDPEPDVPATRPAPMRPRRRSLNTIEARARRRRIVSYGALAISFGFLVNALVGEKGVLARMNTRQDYEIIEARLAAVRRENAELVDEASRLKNDPATIESVAREKLNLIWPGETLIIIKQATPSGGQ
jgi:cell division protein FtsB